MSSPPCPRKRDWSHSTLNEGGAHSQVMGQRKRDVELRRTVQSMLDSRGSEGVPRSFTFHDSRRLYFLGQTSTFGPNDSLFYVELPSGGGAGEGERELITSVDVREWDPLLTEPFKKRGPMSKEEILLRERTRTVATGVTSYSLDASSSKFLVPAEGTLFSISAEPGADEPTILEVTTDRPGARMDAKRNPSQESMISFVRHGDLWVTDEASESERRLTHARATKNDTNLSAGVADYIAQEEFDRYTGYWWQPRVIGEAKERGVEGEDDPTYRIFFHHVDESDVSRYYIPKAGAINGEVDEYRYPLAGGTNPVVKMGLLEFERTADAHPSRTKMLGPSLKDRFPWVEYVPRCGWVPQRADSSDAPRVWMWLLDRTQQRTAIVTVPITEFKEDGGGRTSDEAVHSVLFEEHTDVWINVTDLTTFLDDGRVILSSERTGYRHLYILEEGDVRPITEGGGNGWIVLDRPLSVDQERELVYFVGNRETPLENHLYVASYARGSDPAAVRLLTKAGFSHDTTMSAAGDMFVSRYSRPDFPWQAAVFKLAHGTEGTLPLAQTLAYVRLPLSFTAPSFPVKPPLPFTFESISGKTGYGAYFLPPGHKEGDGPYPTLLYVYGGPHVQLVTGCYAMNTRWRRLQLVASEGFVVVIADGVGSWNRGLAWEGHLKHNMGTPEVQDQVNALKLLIKRGICDPARIAVTGTSYGGYLSLRFIGLRPDFFKLAVSVAPVTLWEAYDTAYTERYMGTPQDQAEAYSRASVLTLAEDFPDDENRLMIVHGEIDENVHYANTSRLLQALIEAGKPYQLQLYPAERHGLRAKSSLRHYEFTFLSYLKRHL